MRIRSSVIVVWLFCACGNVAAADVYPSKEIELVVPYPPGGGYDQVARLVSAKLAQRWGQSVVIRNRPGAGGTIGMAYTARSAPDGYTLIVAGPGDVAIAPLLYRNLPYNTVKDFAPITTMASFALMLGVHRVYR